MTAEGDLFAVGRIRPIGGEVAPPSQDRNLAAPIFQ
jgi:hypothetical protein